MVCEVLESPNVYIVKKVKGIIYLGSTISTKTNMKRFIKLSTIAILTAFSFCFSLNLAAQNSAKDTLLVLLGRITDANSSFLPELASNLTKTTSAKLSGKPISERESTLLYLIRAVSEAKLDRIQDATDDFSSALKQSKKTGNKILQSIVLLHYGTFLQQKQGEGEKAISKLEEALSLAKSAGNDTLKAETLLQIGSIYWGEANFTKAMSAFNQATSIGTGQNNYNITIRGLANQALCNRDLGHLNTSLTLIDRAIEEARQHLPQWLSSLQNLKGSIYYKFGQQDSAISAYQQGLSTASNEVSQAELRAVLFENLALCFKEKQQRVKAQLLLDSALTIRKQNLDTLGLAKTYTQRGNLFLQGADYADALESYLTALELRQQMKNKAEIAGSLTNIGLLYRTLGLNEKALSYFSQALEERLQSGSSIEIGDAYTHLGNTYFDVKKYEEALDSYKKALSYREKAKDNTLKARSLNSIATADQMLGNNNAAESNFAEALNLYQVNRDAKGLAIVRNNLGNFYLSQNRLSEALKNFYIASKINQVMGNKLAEGLCYRKIGEIYLSQNLTAKADSALKASLALGKSTRNFEHLKNTYLALYKLALKNNDLQQALNSYISFSQYQDSIAKTKTSEELMDTRLTMELDRKKSDIQKIENEIEVLRKEALLQESELQRQKNLKFFLISISLILIVLGVVLFRAYRLKKQTAALLQERYNLVNTTNEKLAKSESELITLNQTKDKFFSIIAHDLKNPFSALLGFSELLEKNAETLSTEEVVTYSQTINGASQRLFKLLENLLQWARTQTGKIPFTPITFPLNDAIYQNINLQELNAEAKNISMEFETIESYEVVADVEMVNTVLRNLLSNAIKFTPTNGRISISAIKKEDLVEISISDSGIGMSEEDRQKLFRIDVHYTTKGTDQEEGSGLGLIICKEFVEKQGGEIWVNSIQGEGTTFYFTLPIKK